MVPVIGGFMLAYSAPFFLVFRRCVLVTFSAALAVLCLSCSSTGLSAIDGRPTDRQHAPDGAAPPIPPPVAEGPGHDFLATASGSEVRVFSVDGTSSTILNGVFAENPGAHVYDAVGNLLLVCEGVSMGSSLACALATASGKTLWQRRVPTSQKSWWAMGSDGTLAVNLDEAADQRAR